MTWRGRQPALRNVSTTLLADRASVIVLRQAIDFNERNEMSADAYEPYDFARILKQVRAALQGN
jgi:hypothetical protein